MNCLKLIAIWSLFIFAPSLVETFCIHKEGAFLSSCIDLCIIFFIFSAYKVSFNNKKINGAGFEVYTLNIESAFKIGKFILSQRFYSKVKVLHTSLYVMLWESHHLGLPCMERQIVPLFIAALTWYHLFSLLVWKLELDWNSFKQEPYCFYETWHADAGCDGHIAGW